MCLCACILNVSNHTKDNNTMSVLCGKLNILCVQVCLWVCVFVGYQWVVLVSEGLECWVLSKRCRSRAGRLQCCWQQHTLIWAQTDTQQRGEEGGEERKEEERRWFSQERWDNIHFHKMWRTKSNRTTYTHKYNANAPQHTANAL